MSHDYDVIIGLEVHVQLQTLTKIFCGCSTAFNPDRPNIQTCPVCLGLPGALPVLNQTAFRLAVKTALGLGCEIAGYTKWDRKQYFYPDLPKGYQISQFDLPFSNDGFVDVQVAGDSAAAAGTPESPEKSIRRVRILRAHLEEDAGKNMHDESGRGRDSKVDLNRAGTPLVEIVTHPDLRSADEARRFLEELKLLLTYLEVSDCNMQEGSLRCDANVNLHVHLPDGSKVPTPIVEVKNLNSFRFTEQAIEFEISRQWEQFQANGIKLGDPGGYKSTRGYDPNRGQTYPLRKKRKRPTIDTSDPDLVPVTMTAVQMAEIQAQMCEAPAVRRERFQRDYQLTPYDAAVIIDQGRLFADYFESVAKVCGDAKQAANWMTQDVLREMKERGKSVSEFAIHPEVLSGLLERINRKQITIKSARDVFTSLLSEFDGTLVAPGVNRIDELIAAKGLAIVQDLGAIDAAITTVLAKNPKAIADFKAGKQAAIGALIGQVMREVKGADPQAVREKVLAAIEIAPA